MITLKMVQDEWQACYSADRLALLYEHPLTVLEVLTKIDTPVWKDIPAKDRIWTILRKEVLPREVLVEFAKACADRAKTYDVAAAAYAAAAAAAAAAYAAAADAAYAAAYAAADAAAAAADAAYAAAYAAADAAAAAYAAADAAYAAYAAAYAAVERQKQVDWLVNYLSTHPLVSERC